MQTIGVPLRFYQRNLFVGAAILGTGTALSQRIICGKPIKKAQTAVSQKSS